MTDKHEPQENMHQILSEMMQHGFTQQQLLDCNVDTRYYTPEEYTNLSQLQKYKLFLVHNFTNRPPGIYNASQVGTYPPRYWDPANWPHCSE